MRKILTLGSLLIAGAALGAAGDALYRAREVRDITPTQAQCYATCAKSHNGWSGTLADARSICVERTASGAGFQLAVSGVKRAPYASVPKPVEIEGVE